MLIKFKLIKLFAIYINTLLEQHTQFILLECSYTYNVICIFMECLLIYIALVVTLCRGFWINYTHAQNLKNMFSLPTILISSFPF